MLFHPRIGKGQRLETVDVPLQGVPYDGFVAALFVAKEACRVTHVLLANECDELLHLLYIHQGETSHPFTLVNDNPAQARLLVDLDVLPGDKLTFFMKNRRTTRLHRNTISLVLEPKEKP
jgi:hypothetical protein